MKKTKLIYIAVATALVVGSCKQEPIVLKPAEVAPPVTPSKGGADFTKFVALGDSYTAGFQSSALFTEGQANSLGAIMATQFATVGGGAFNQPDINSVNGFNATSSNVGAGLILGRLILFDPDGPTGPRTAGPAAANTPARSVTCPSAVTTPAVPAPFNSALSPLAPEFLFDPTKRAALNNFGVPGMKLLEAVGVPSYATLNPLYGRFATAAGGTAMFADAASKQPTFFSFFLGNFDVLGYATSGGVGLQDGTSPTDMTPVATFTSVLNTALNGMLATPGNEGVVGNIPDVTLMPFFRTVLFNAVSLTAQQATDLNAGFSGYNQVLDGIKGNAALMAGFGLTAAGLDARKVIWAAGAGNQILIADKTLTDLGPVFDQLVLAGAMTAGQRTQLDGYRRVREASSSDLILLSAGATLGTCLNPPGNNATLIIGTSIALGDQFVLLPSEVAAIQARVTAFNSAIQAAVTANSARLALADVNAELTKLVTSRILPFDGVSISPSFAPPTGAFSEDGLHFNSRGYAYLANIFIDAINTKFTATVPRASLAKYKGTALPINP